MAVKFTDAGMLDGRDDDYEIVPTEDQIEIDRLEGELYVAGKVIARLEAEVEHLRSMSSAGYARGQIKQAPTNGWPVQLEQEDFL